MPSFFRIRTIGLLVALTFGAGDLQAGVRYKSDVGEYPSKLRAEKWGVAISGVKADPDDAPLVAAPDAKRMVVQAIQDLPGSDQVPLEARQELARIAKENFEKIESSSKEGKLGNLEYRIGRYSFTSRPQGSSPKADGLPNGGIRQQWMPYIAVRIVD
jgi:hypothetical protein